MKYKKFQFQDKIKQFSQRMKMPSHINQSRPLLYILSTLAFFNVFSYLVWGNMQAVLLFVLIGIILRIFTPNMIWVLGVPLVVVNLITATQSLREGLEGMDSTDDKTDNDNKDNKDVGKKDSKPKKDTSKQVTTDEANSTTMHTTVSSNTAKPSESFEVGAKGQKRIAGGGSRVDYGATLEQAYDNLNKMLDGDGIQKLTGDTQKLIEQQSKLAEAMDNMSGLFTQASSMMEKIDSSGFGKILDNPQVQSMLGGLNGKKNAPMVAPNASAS